MFPDEAPDDTTSAPQAVAPQEQPPHEQPDGTPDEASSEQANPAGAGAALAGGVEPNEAEAAPHAPSGVSSDLEEELYEPTVQDEGPSLGEVRAGYTLREDLGRGWFKGQDDVGGQALIYARPDPRWADLAPHRLLPRSKRREGGVVVDWADGEVIHGPLATAEALAYLTDLARLVYALEKQGYALTDLDPGGVVRGERGLRLRFPPRVALTGEPVGPVLREGLTPPEVLSGEPAQASSGVYLLGALLYLWLTGETLAPLGGEGRPGIVRDPGVPQLLRGALAPAGSRLQPEEFLQALLALNEAPLPVYKVAAATTVGLNPERPVNEDAYGYRLEQIEAHGEREMTLLACVADGMGGMAAGEVASRAAVQAFLAPEHPEGGHPDIVTRVWRANAAVIEALGGQEGGCAFSGVEVRGEQLQLGHVGDTRVYLLSSEGWRQLSTDHSYVAALVASGVMSPEEAAQSPERNKVLRSLGSLRQPQDQYVDTGPPAPHLQAGDRLLLVSDGVWGEVTPGELQRVVREEQDLQAAADELVALALQAGAPDNATALLVERRR